MTFDEARTFLRLYREFTKAGFEIIFPYVNERDVDEETFSFEAQGEMIASLPDEEFAQFIAEVTGGSSIAAQKGA